MGRLMPSLKYRRMGHRRNSFGNVEFDLNQTQCKTANAAPRLPFFHNPSKMRDIMDWAEGVFSRRTIQQRRGLLMSSVWTSASDSDDARHLRSPELRTIGRDLLANAFQWAAKTKYRLNIQRILKCWHRNSRSGGN